MTPHFISPAYRGEYCGICGLIASHKVGEEIPRDEPRPTVQFSDGIEVISARHEFTQYVCCACFKLIFGKEVWCP